MDDLLALAKAVRQQQSALRLMVRLVVTMGSVPTVDAPVVSGLLATLMGGLDKADELLRQVRHARGAGVKAKE